MVTMVVMVNKGNMITNHVNWATTESCCHILIVQKPGKSKVGYLQLK